MSTERNGTPGDPTLAEFAVEWEKYQNLLVKSLAPLTREQLDLRLAPHLRSIGEIATHMVGARARWLRIDLAEGDATLDALGSWDRKGMPARTAAELADGLRHTWQVMRDAMVRWTEAQLSEVLESDDWDEPFPLTRRWVIWHLLEHDLHHGGEVSFSLGVHDLPAPDL
jgi:uncharacterized damage-inducible protein DinB